MTNKKKFKSFGDFTNLYELSKTLRFELKPVGNTQKMLDKADVFGKDKIIKDKYEKTKPFIDRLHREFINESFQNVNLSGLKKYKNTLDNWKNNKKDREAQKELKKEEERLRKEIVKCFDSTAKNWAKKYFDLNLKKDGIGILFEVGVFGILKNKYGADKNSFLRDENGNFVLDDNNKKISIFDEWEGFIGYFTKFQETRKNFYKEDGTETALATRIIDQNLKRFCDNIDGFKKIKNKEIDFFEVEENFGRKADDVFYLDFYNNCLLQNGIDLYNEFLGGKTLENGKKLKGINELINEYRQKNKNDKISFLEKLDKQLLSEKEGINFIKEIKDDKQLLIELKDFQKKSEEKVKILKILFSNFVSDNDKYELDKIYFSKVAFNTISRKWTGNTQKFEELLYNAMKDDKPIGLNYDKNDNFYKFPDFIALNYFKKALQDKTIYEEKFWKDKYYTEDENKNGFLVVGENGWSQFLKIFDFEFNSLLKFVDDDKKEVGFDIFKKELESLISQKDFLVNEKAKVIIKNFADNFLWIYQLGKYFAVEKKRGWDNNYELDSFFYNHINFGFKDKFYDNAYEDIVQKYNLFRNYLTKKPYSEDKWKLNFENPTLANGFDKNKESDNSAVFLRKDGKYYLGIMSKGNSRVFDDKNKDKFSENIGQGKYEKIVYKYLPDAAKMIPKCSTQLKDVKNHFSNSKEDFFILKSFTEPLRITKRIFDLNNTQYGKTNIKKIVIGEDKGIKLFQKEYYKLSNDFGSYKSALSDWIDFCKNFINKYGSTKDFNIYFFRKTENYNSLDEFYNDVAKIAYKISFQDITEDYIEQKNQNSELYLFEIYNQDFAKGKTGTKNLHTIYFENLFSNENIDNNFTFKLNGQAELFFRPKSINKKEEKRNFVRKITNKKRYSEDKIFFHCPITLNREAGSIYRFNDYVNNFLSESRINIIGVDRGEKHLAYYSVIDQKGKKIDGGSFNEINGVNYFEKLEKREGDRERARKDWQEVEKIKDLKRGYISQVVKKLVDLAIKYNAIIVLEDLNMRFKQIRGGIEKSIYQQLEKALIDKLSFLVKKGEKNVEQAGHLLRAYQLTAPFTSFKEMGKQTGIIFYTQASYTSKTCPDCGFRKNINAFRFENIEKAKDVLKKLELLNYDSNHKCFVVSYNLNKFLNNEQKRGGKRGNILFENIKRKDDFIINSKDANRYRWHNINSSDSKKENAGEKIENRTGSGVIKKYDITKCLKGLFEKNNLDYKKDLITQIISENKLQSDFYRKLFWYLNLLLDIRNSVSGTDVDYISCPKCGFNSKNSKEIENGDANGAYNIARKGIMILEKIKKYKKDNSGLDKISWGDLFIDIEEWDKFSQIINAKKS